MTGTSDKTINVSKVKQHYPTKSDMISDVPAKDSGGNFGRLARTKILDNYKTDLFKERLAGISLSSWQRFLKIFIENSPLEKMDRELENLAASISNDQKANNEKNVELIEKIREILRFTESGS